MVNMMGDLFSQSCGVNKVFPSESPTEAKSDIHIFMDLGWKLISFFTPVTWESENIVQSSKVFLNHGLP